MLLCVPTDVDVDRLAAALARAGVVKPTQPRSIVWQMTTVLRYLRDDCAFAFDAAWSRALMSLPRPMDAEGMVERAEWAAHLDLHRPVWKAAYERSGAVVLPDEVHPELADLVEQELAAA
jgi:hypothetical protein